MDFYRFIPLYKARVWGGERLGPKFGRQLPTLSEPVGESWEMVDRPDDQSVVAEGPLKGLTLSELCEHHGRKILSPGYNHTRPFPILIKWLDCKERLSLQVHPPAAIAPKLKGEPKTECWTVVEATKDAGVFAGLKTGTTPAAFAAALKTNTLESLCHRIPTQAGDFLFIPSGRLHAIDAGNVILEIQQNSDTTYRVYDWGRPRPLHLRESLVSINFNDFAPAATPPNGQATQILTQNPLFTVTRHTIPEGGSFTLPAMASAAILTIVEGPLGRFASGENLLIPFGQAVSLKASRPCVVITTTDFI